MFTSAGGEQVSAGASGGRLATAGEDVSGTVSPPTPTQTQAPIPAPSPSRSPAHPTSTATALTPSRSGPQPLQDGAHINLGFAPAGTLPPPTKFYADPGVVAPPYTAFPQLTPEETAFFLLPPGSPRYSFGFDATIAWGPLYQPLVQAGWSSGNNTPDAVRGIFAVQAQATSQTNASLTWTIDYGDGSAPQIATDPARSCTYSAADPPETLRYLLPSVPNHTYAYSSTFTVKVTVAITGCDGTPGPTATTSFSYVWMPPGEVEIDAPSEVRNWVPSPTWTLPDGVTVTAGTVIEAPTDGSNQFQSGLALYAYCDAPAQEPGGAVFTITCTTVSADSSDPVTFTCQGGPCAGVLDENPIELTPGTMYGAPAATGVLHVTETMPYSFYGMSFDFTVTQGSHSTYAEVQVVTVQ